MIHVFKFSLTILLRIAVNLYEQTDDAKWLCWAYEKHPISLSQIKKMRNLDGCTAQLQLLNNLDAIINEISRFIVYFFCIIPFVKTGLSF